ncbi:MAG TPA: hypothetical protein PLP50_00855 [Thermoanaerobaculia bacterium]|nr:hypothetical protein [Thermoanaerobaculia bacterium]HQN08471.1 hypothetical protein [Thermoanaerobaculia bacterium]HQP85065.1 hypothetical protein [Thermoanaerobaculia bacterium]
MGAPYREVLADGYDVATRGQNVRPRRVINWTDRQVCRAILAPASPGAISTNCPNKPVNDLGFCAAHAR